MTWRALLAIGIVLIATGRHCIAQNKGSPEIEKVTVTGERPDPEKISYSKMLDAMDLFDKDHSRAPDAVLLFRIIPTHKFDTSGLRLTIKSDNERIPVPLNPDLTFSVPRIDRLRDKDAYLVVNKNSDNFVWHAYVHLPGMNANQVRLGDLRIQCRIDLKAGLFTYIGLTALPVSSMFYDDPCISAHTVNWVSFYAFHPVFNVTMSDGTKKKEFESKYLWMSGPQDEVRTLITTNYQRSFLYEPPTKDLSWPDSSLITIEYMNENIVDSDQTGT